MLIHRIEAYLDHVMAYARLPDGESERVRAEMRDHLLCQVENYVQHGATQDDAAFRAIQDCGEPSRVGYGLRPRFPLVDVRLRGTARGVVAIGPRAVGIFACGVVATGVVAVGAVSVGAFSLGAVGISIILGVGGLSLGSLSIGLNAIGLVAIGMNSLGVVCSGMNAVGIWATASSFRLSYYDYGSVPEWLEIVGNIIGLTGTEIVVCFAPFLVVFASVICASTYFAWCERHRLKRQNLWIFQA